MIYINAKKPQEKSALSPVVMGALSAKSMGPYIPKFVVTSTDQMTYMTSLAYKKMNDKAFRAANAQVKEGLAGSPVPKPKDAYDCWTIASNGRHYVGEFVELKNSKTLILKSPRDKKMKIPMSELTLGAQKYARFLSGSGQESTPKEKAEIEEWQSAQGGKSIRATFISLNGELITLRKEDGKTLTFKLSLLSEESQQRAEKLSGQ